MEKWSETTVWVADRINKKAILKSFVITHISKEIKMIGVKNMVANIILEYKHMIQ